ncbi:MAG: hypothetical protein GC200_03315 [Tepidisphaera sp.]|nr:hypothetical protein [Tepidisphaera sp.]
MGFESPQVHAVQVDIAWEDPETNFARVRDLLGRAPVKPGDLVVLPEMFSTGFSFNVQRTSDASGATLRFLEDLARLLRVTIQGGRTLNGAAGEKARNVMTMVGGDAPEQPRPLGEYSKIHPFQREAEVIAGGDRVMVYPWRADPGREIKVCPVICYDLRFPELFRRGLDLGAEVYAIGACWPSVRHAHWRALSIARAIENQAFVIACNRAGDDPAGSGGLHYAGGSMVLSPMGEVLGELGEEPGVLSVPLDFGVLDAWRGKFSAWKDRKL